jgi:osmoprotectant transport system permease protein
MSPTVLAAVDDLVNWEWVARNLDDILARTRQHVVLTVAAVGIGFVVAFGLSLWSLSSPRARKPITVATAVSYTVPSLAVFVFLVPFTGLGVTTSLIGLSLYTLLILVRNIVAGLDGVADEVLDAARGMGLDDRRILWRVRLPLALPVIVGGVRIATVTTVGLVTVTALVGQGGLGWFILRGLNSVANRSTLVIVGVVLSVALAIAFDLAIERVGRRITPWVRQRET